MPIQTFRCACGKTADVLVRSSGRAPATCDEAAEFGFCDAPQSLTRQITAPFVASGGAPRSAPDPTCGHCGQVPGSCADDT
jgi:hypothetical protein